MKTTYKVVGAIFGLGMVILLGFHLFLQYGLTKAMREVVLPRVRQETGIDVRVKRLSLNVPNGRLYLKGIAIRNPEGFRLENFASVKKASLEVDVLSLLKNKLVRVKNLRVNDARINVVRNEAGDLNIDRLQKERPEPPTEPSAEPMPEPAKPAEPPAPQESRPVAEPKTLPEILIETLACQARLRYVDMKLDDIDVALQLELTGRNLSTQHDPSAEWGEVLLEGALGDDKTGFVTDLRLELAPVTDPEALSFDLTGRIMEIDPELLEEAYDKIGIRSAPFGFDPQLYCRENRFERSSFALNLKDIRLEDKLADKLGGMGSIESLRFAVPVEGTLEEPSIDLAGALLGAVGGNSQSLLTAFLRGAAAGEAGAEDPPESLSDAAVEALGKQVEEVGESEALKNELKGLGRRLFGD